jgi:hydrogenase maturation protease
VTTQQRRAAIGVVGIGNPVVGDDGAGIAVIERIKPKWGADPGVLLLTLEGDLFELSDHLGRAERFVFADAVAGGTLGEITRSKQAPRAFAPSFHQLDVGAVMAALANLDLISPFPHWEIWGISIDPPREVRRGLSPPVAEAVETLAASLSRLIEETVAAENVPGENACIGGQRGGPGEVPATAEAGPMCENPGE